MTGTEKLQQIIDNFKGVLDGDITAEDVFKLLRTLILAAEELYTVGKAGSLKKEWVLDSWDYINNKYKVVDKIPNWWIKKAVKWFGKSIIGFVIDGLVSIFKMDKVLVH